MSQTGQPFFKPRFLTLQVYPLRYLQGLVGQSRVGQEHLATGHKVHNPPGAITFSILHSLDPQLLAQLGVLQATNVGQPGNSTLGSIDPHLMLGHGMHPAELKTGTTVQVFVPQSDAQVSQARIDGHGAS